MAHLKWSGKRTKQSLSLVGSWPAGLYALQAPSRLPKQFIIRLVGRRKHETRPRRPNSTVRPAEDNRAWHVNHRLPAYLRARRAHPAGHWRAGSDGSWRRALDEYGPGAAEVPQTALKIYNAPSRRVPEARADVPPSGFGRPLPRAPIGFSTLAG